MNTSLTVNELIEDYQSVLKKYCIKSEFIDPVDDIIDKLKNSSYLKSRPFAVYLKSDLISFYTIDSANINLGINRNNHGAYWLESFFITEKYRGKGLGKKVVCEIIKSMNKYFPEATTLNLTVNFRNHVAKNIYIECGMKDTGEIYDGGPVGPQHIFSIKI